MGSVTWRKRGHRYQVSWRLDDGSQGAKTVDSADETLIWSCGPASAAPSPPRKPASCWRVSRCSGWDHVITLLGTGLRIGELAGLHRRRVHLDQPIPTLQVVDVRYQAGSQFGSGFKPRPKSDASIREVPLAPQPVEAIRRRLPHGSDPAALLFTGPGGGPGQRGGSGVKKGTRTVLSRHNFRRTYHGALTKLANPAAAGLRPTAARVLGVLRDHGPLSADQLVVQTEQPGSHRHEGHR
jgi:hypothetical protein